MGNIALNKPVTTNKSILPYTGSKAVDGVSAPSNRWLTDLVPATIMVDLQARYLVNRWVVKHPSTINGWNSTNYANTDYKLQGSNDNGTWYDLDTVTNNSYTVTDRNIAPVVYRYFRVYVSKGLRCNSHTTSILEFELYQAFSAQLTNLAISPGILTPAFNPATLNYTATVNPDVTSVNVTPTALSPAALIKVNNVPVASGAAIPVAVNFGTNAITVNVTDGAITQNYTITVTRLGSCLSSLTVQTTNGVNIPLTPAFVSGTQNYTASVGNDIVQVTFTPTAQKSTATITIKGETVQSGVVSKAFDIGIGTNQIPIVVTADGVSFQYTVTITRAAGTNLYLDRAVVAYSGRGITPGNVNVPMNDAQTDYPVTVLTGSTAVTVTPFARDLTAVIKVNNVVVVSGNASGSIPLNSSGTTTVTIVVSTPDGSSSRTYTLTISKGTI